MSRYTRQQRRRVQRAERTSQCPPRPPAPSASPGPADEDRVLQTTLRDHPAPVSGWLRLGDDAAFRILSCRGCGAREEVLLRRGPVTSESLMRMFDGDLELLGFATRHAACDDRTPVRAAAGSPWQLPETLPAEVREWADAALDYVAEPPDCGAPFAGQALVRVAHTPGGEPDGPHDVTMPFTPPELDPAEARGPAHRRWHARLRQHAERLGGRLTAVLIMSVGRVHAMSGAGPHPDARARRRAGRTAASRKGAVDGVTAVLITRSGVYARLFTLPADAGTAAGLAQCWCVVGLSAMVDGLMAE